MVDKLIKTLEKNNVDLMSNEEDLDRAMKILKYNYESHYNILLFLYRRNGRMVVKELKRQLNLSNDAYYKREHRLKRLGLLKVIPKERSRIWSREVELSQPAYNWLSNEG